MLLGQRHVISITYSRIRLDLEFMATLTDLSYAFTQSQLSQKELICENYPEACSISIAFLDDLVCAEIHVHGSLILSRQHYKTVEM